jgi:hypothetical protein
MKRTKYTYRFLYMLTTLLLLGSCQLGKHYTRPKLDLPETLDSLSARSICLLLLLFRGWVLQVVSKCSLRLVEMQLMMIWFVLPIH